MDKEIVRDSPVRNNRMADLDEDQIDDEFRDEKVEVREELCLT